MVELDSTIPLKKKQHREGGAVCYFFGHPAAEPSCLCFENALPLRGIPLLSSFKCSLIKLKMLLLYLASLKLGGRLWSGPQGGSLHWALLRTDLGFAPDVNIPNLALLKESLWTTQYLYLFKYYILILIIKIINPILNNNLLIHLKNLFSCTRSYLWHTGSSSSSP